MESAKKKVPFNPENVFKYSTHSRMKLSGSSFEHRPAEQESPLKEVLGKLNS